MNKERKKKSMANKNSERVRITTPKGTATGFVALQTPSTKFNANGVYSVALELEAKEGEKLLKQINEIRAAKFKEVKDSGKKAKLVDITCLKLKGTTEVDDDGNETFTPDPSGNYVLTAKLTAKGKTKEGKEYESKPALFDAKGLPFKSKKQIATGSTLRLQVEASGYFVAALGVGVSLKLKSVQVVDLVEYGGSSFEDTGFDVEENGYVDTAEDTEYVDSSTPASESEEDEQEDF